MSMLGELAASITGPWLRALLVPGLIIGSVTAVHQLTKARAEARAAQEAVLVTRGRQQCLAEVQLAQARADLGEERRKTALARNEAANAISLAREVGDQINVLESKLREVEAAAPGNNPGCLSDGMRQRIWGATGPPSSGSGAASGSHR